MKPLGDTFINPVKMVIAPIIFLTIVLGVSRRPRGHHMSTMRLISAAGLALAAVGAGALAGSARAQRQPETFA